MTTTTTTETIASLAADAALALMLGGRSRDAAVLARVATALAPGGAAQLTYGAALADLGHIEQAIAAFAAATRPGAAGLCALGAARSELGEYAGAVAALARAIALDPADSDFARALLAFAEFHHAHEESGGGKATDVLRSLRLNAEEGQSNPAVAHIAYMARTLGDATPTVFGRRRHLIQAVRAATATAGDDDLFLEFGVAHGGSLRVIANELATAPAPHKQQRLVHGFDSFTGLPEAWDGTGDGQGAYTTGGRPPPAATLPHNCRLHAGFFEDAVPAFFASAESGGRGRRVAFAHVDVDLASSARAVLATLAPRLARGAVLRFDEWRTPWSDADADAIGDEEDAWREVARERGIAWRPLSWSGQGVSIVVNEIQLPSLQNSAQVSSLTRGWASGIHLSSISVKHVQQLEPGVVDYGYK